VRDGDDRRDPPAGAEVIVFNDINIFNSPVAAAREPVLADSVNNRQLYRNIVNYTGVEARATAARVAMYFGHHTLQTSFLCDAHFDLLKSEFSQAGFTTDSLTADLTSPIDPAYKVIMLVLPTTAFSNLEINNLKQFASQGGRIVFIGEWVPLYTGRDAENAFLASMGAQLTNKGGAFDGGGVKLPASSLRQHQLTTGLTGLWIANASEVTPGPNDYAIIYDSSNQHVLVAAAKVDVTPLSINAVVGSGARMNKAAVQTIAVPVQGTLGGDRPKTP